MISEYHRRALIAFPTEEGSFAQKQYANSY
jgi:hypothetical protein